MVAEITGFRRELVCKFAVVTDKPVAPVLDGNDAGYHFEQVLELVALLVEFTLLAVDGAAHLADGFGQLPHFVGLVHFNRCCIVSVFDALRAVD